ncbi:hypothetical protein V1522DRAFT_399118 [Lipomyces starkeyi]
MKRIILLCDGTWQDSLAQTHWYPSNVSRLARAIKPVNSEGIAQVVYYHPGVGSEGGILGWFLGGTFGEGIIEQMKEVYCFLSYNYVPGDEIFFFGFSRGSYMVRALCSLVMEFGILRKSGMSEFVEVFQLFMKKKFEENEALKNLQEDLAKRGALIKPEYEKHKITVKAIGCFDTVGSLGVPRIFPWQKNDYKFLDLKLNKNVEHAFHALALDEPRIVFRPTLWFFDPKGPNFDNYKQVWFTGNHENIGGGPMYGTAPHTNLLPPSNKVRIPNYLSEGTLAWLLSKFVAQVPNVLSDGTLIWMVSQCRDLLDIDHKYLHIDIRGGHTRRDGELDYTKAFDSHPRKQEPVWYRGPINYNIFFILLGAIPFWPWPPRDVGGYFPWEKDYDWFFVRWLKWLEHMVSRKSKEQRLDTKERVHISVYNRDLITGTQSAALRNVILDPPNESGNGDVVMEKEKNGTQHVQVSQGARNKKHIPLECYSQFEETFWRDEGQDIHDTNRVRNSAI